LEVARHSETEELLVIYCSLEDPGTTWVRPVEMFSELVESPDGTSPRFELAAPFRRRPRRSAVRLVRDMVRRSHVASRLSQNRSISAI
jgi:hypothetical protein